ncbi:MAG TPA: hypothetical protein VFK05_26015 [Polyangiaceae bacterium]|nr:hypothetical protein [Polyangiaceae bacterium]
MSPLLGPILAQLVTLTVSDRTEARHIVANETGSYSEVATYPRAGLYFGWKHTTLTLGYSPSLTFTPLEDKHPEALLFHSAYLAMAQRWRRTTLSLSQSGGYGRVSLRGQALGDPRAIVGTGAPQGNTTPPPATTGATGMPPATGGTAPPAAMGTNPLPSLALQVPITFVSSVTTLNVNQLLSAVLSVSGGVSYFYSGSVGDDVPQGPANQQYYPTVKGPGAQVLVTYQPTHADSVTTSAFSQLADTSNGNRAWLLVGNETWTHRLTRQTNTTLGAGLSLTRNSQPNNLVFYSIYPNFQLSINHTSRLDRNVITLGAGASSAPFLDPVRGIVDPRVGTYAYAGLTKDKFSTSLNAYTGVQIGAGNTGGVLNSASGTLNVSYRLGDAVWVDSGVRTAWQAYQGTAQVPISFGVYAGINVALSTPLHGRK